MKGRGIAALAATAALASLAAASFDLVLVLDVGNRGIHRFDGDTGVYLGKINTPQNTTVRSMTVDQANRRVFVSDDTGFHAYNYHTGQLLFSNYASSTIARLEYVEGYGLVRAATNSGTATRMETPSASATFFGTAFATGVTADYRGIQRDSFGDFVMLDSAGMLYRGVGSNLEVSISIGGGFYTDLAVRGTDYIATRVSSGSIVFGNTQVPQTATGSTNIGIFQARAFAFGHENIRYGAGVLTDGAGAVSRLTVTNTGMPVAVMDIFGEGILDSPIDIEVVTAPEPGTMIALGAGVLALLRRRGQK